MAHEAAGASVGYFGLDIDITPRQAAARAVPECPERPAMPWDHPNPFTLSLAPQAGDIDGLDHTNNGAYVRWCEDIAWAHSERLGLAVADYRRLDRAMAIRRSEYDYLLPTVLGEALTLATWILAGDGRITLERHFQLVRDADGATVLRGRWALVCIEVSSGRARRMPPEFIQAYVLSRQGPQCA